MDEHVHSCDSSERTLTSPSGNSPRTRLWQHTTASPISADDMSELLTPPHCHSAAGWLVGVLSE